MSRHSRDLSGDFSSDGERFHKRAKSAERKESRRRSSPERRSRDRSERERENHRRRSKERDRDRDRERYRDREKNYDFSEKSRREERDKLRERIKDKEIIDFRKESIDKERDFRVSERNPRTVLPSQKTKEKEIINVRKDLIEKEHDFRVSERNARAVLPNQRIKETEIINVRKESADKEHNFRVSGGNQRTVLPNQVKEKEDINVTKESTEREHDFRVPESYQRTVIANQAVFASQVKDVSFVTDHQSMISKRVGGHSFLGQPILVKPSEGQTDVVSGPIGREERSHQAPNTCSKAHVSAPSPVIATPKVAALNMIGIPSECLLLKNMFDPSTETEPDFESDTKGDIEDECSRFGLVKHMFIDRNSHGFVYLRFESMASAINAQRALHGRWFSGNMVTATFMLPESYMSKFPSA